MAFSQEPLPYGFNDLEPHFDSSVLEIHFTKHHAGYVSKLNAALEGTDQINTPLETLVSDLSDIDVNKRAAVKKLAGQHYNHALYWNSLSPNGGGEPNGEIAKVINSNFGSFADFKEKFNNAAATQFGSGWAWLSLKDGKLEISSTGNEDTPLMNGAAPLLTLDVWEHAYYLQFQNRRPDFISAFWKVINWDNVNKLYAAASN